MIDQRPFLRLAEQRGRCAQVGAGAGTKIDDADSRAPGEVRRKFRGQRAVAGTVIGRLT